MQAQNASLTFPEKDQLSMPNNNERALWEKEYGAMPTIPSSHRLQPSHALVELARGYDLSVEKALDLGCGNGRNSFYLAKSGANVTAIDFSKEALNILRHEKRKSNLPGSIKQLNIDISNGLPLESNSFDLVLDSYCLCHFISEKELKDAITEVHRVLKPGGRLIKVHIDSSDKYYLQRARRKTSYGHISYDPANGIQKMHMSLDSYLSQFRGDFRFIKSECLQFNDNVRGVPYKRSIFLCVTEKPFS